MPIKLNENFGKQGFYPVVMQQIKGMINEYRTNLRPASTNALRSRFKATATRPIVEETSFAWVSKAEIEEFFKENPTADGMRIYFAAHDTSTLATLHHEYEGQLTVVMVSTKCTFDSTGAIIRIDDLLNDNPALGPVNSVSYAVSVPASGQYGTNGIDQYPLCPPNCIPGTSL